jgi:hypothetical protein
MHTEDDTFDRLINPLKGDEITFGRGKWVYCLQHLRPHLTGWCTVSDRDKIALDAIDGVAAYNECDSKGLKVYKNL